MKFEVTLQTREVRSSEAIKIIGTLEISEGQLNEIEVGEIALMLEIQANGGNDNYIREMFKVAYNKWPLRVWVERS